MANKLNHEKRKTILRMLCEGNSIRGTSRAVGVDKGTVERTIRVFGDSCGNFMDDHLRELKLRHVQIDEQHTFVAKKQARLTVDEKRERGDIGDMFLWIALDTDTKLVASYEVGKRSADMARRLLVDLAGRMVLPKPGSSDDHAYQLGGFKPIVQISTDGFAGYPEAVDLAFGPFAQHGVLIKDYRNAKMQYDPSEIVGTKRKVVSGNISQWSIVTSHVERFNCTTRQFMKRFTRLTLAFSKKLECLKSAVSMYLAYYNWVWRTRYPDYHETPNKLRPTAATMAGLTQKNWKFDDLYNEAIYYG